MHVNRQRVRSREIESHAGKRQLKILGDVFGELKALDMRLVAVPGHANVRRARNSVEEFTVRPSL